MKKILILGASGMAGHMIFKYLKLFPEYIVLTTARNKKYITPDYYINAFDDINIIKNIIVNNELDIIINCIGLLVNECELNIDKALVINCFFPHCLENITKNLKTKIIHLSTDCVFSGKEGDYYEHDIPDETNNYGQCKTLGEINNNKDLTLRMSIIGDELKTNGSGLFEWFLRQNEAIKGYCNCYWSGITTLELAKQIKKIIDLPISLTGLYHLAPDFSINKFELLKLIAEVFNKDIDIFPDSSVRKNKVLINTRKKDYYPNIPGYRIQLQQLKKFII